MTNNLDKTEGHEPQAQSAEVRGLEVLDSTSAVLAAAVEVTDLPERGSEKVSKRGGSKADDNDESDDQKIVRFVQESGAGFFHSEDRVAYAEARVGDHKETWRIRSHAFKLYVDHLFYRRECRIPSAESRGAAINLLEAKALFDGPTLPVSVRIGSHGEATYIDLGDKAWHAVRVSADGWEVTQDYPVHFHRAPGMQALPFPESGGSVEELRDFVNVASEDDWILLVAWLLGALTTGFPYPVLALQGPQGSAKSTTSMLLRSLVDPATAPIRATPSDERDLMIAASNSHVLAFDNLSGMRAWLSDALCRIATGGGFATRALYSNDEERIFMARRPVILNGIDDIATRQDLIDRSIVLNLEAIPEHRRRLESEMLRAFEQARPRILGALFTVVAEAMGKKNSVRLRRLPRMADFACFVTAAEGALGWPSGAFMDAYDGSRQDAITSGLEADPVAIALRSFMEGRDQWCGTASDLLFLLDQGAQNERARGWPKNPQGLSNRIRRISTSLPKVGISVEFTRDSGTDRTRRTIIRKVGNTFVPNVPSRPDQPSDEGNGGAAVGGFSDNLWVGRDAATEILDDLFDSSGPDREGVRDSLDASDARRTWSDPDFND